MPYLPRETSLVYTHHTKIKNIRFTDAHFNADSWIAILDFEKDSLTYDNSMKDRTERTCTM